MTSHNERTNVNHSTLYHRTAADAAEELEQAYETNTTELAAALINALRRIDTLERQVANLRKNLDE